MHPYEYPLHGAVPHIEAVKSKFKPFHKKILIQLTKAMITGAKNNINIPNLYIMTRYF